MSSYSHELGVLLHVAVAMLLGGILGFERQLAGKAAGLRTHMFIAGASALLVGLGQLIVLGERDGLSLVVRSDPLRIIDTIVTAVGIIAAGSIVRREASQVSGLTTAASLIFVAGVGIGVAIDRMALSLGITALGLITSRGITTVEHHIRKIRKSRKARKTQDK